MARVLILSATPRTRGNSAILAEKVAEGVRSAGGTPEILRIAHLDIAPCDACDACQSSRDAPCIIQDDMMDIYPKLLEADAIVFASPIYFFGPSAQLKRLLDRFYALGGGGDWSALAGKRVGLVLTYADSDPMKSGVYNAYGIFRDACAFLRMALVDCVHASCGGEGEVAQNEQVLAWAERMGRALAAP